MSDFNSGIVAEFRANDGRVGGMFEGANMLLLHHLGARSGAERINPLVYLPDGDRVVIYATKSGAPTHPDWYHNLKANPRVTVEIGRPEGGVQTYAADAVEVTGAERDELYARIVADRDGFADYEVKTRGIRTIPVFVLTRAA